MGRALSGYFREVAKVFFCDGKSLEYVEQGKDFFLKIIMTIIVISRQKQKQEDWLGVYCCSPRER